MTQKYTPALPGISLSFSLLMVFFYIGGLAFTEDTVKLFKKKGTALLAGILFVLYFVLDFSTEINIWFLKLVPAVCGIVLVFYVSGLLSCKENEKVLSYLGCKSVNIYVLHAPILICVRILMLNILKLNNAYLFTVVAASVSLVGALLFSKYVVEKVKIFGVLLLGGK